MVQVYDYVIPEEVCNNLIKVFEGSPDNHQYIDKNHKPCFTQLNINHTHPELVRMLIGYTQKVYLSYSDDLKNKFLPRLRLLEEFRIKRYLPNGEERFDEHVDVANSDDCIRALAFLFYLNDNDGETYFTKQDKHVQPKTGRVVVFPPTWEYPHAGLPPTNDTKYILSTYIHYGKN
jgi:hypothetical protein